MSDIDILESVLVKDRELIGAVTPEQSIAPTPCPDYDVRTMVNHLVGWSQVFAAAANGRTFDGDPTAYDGPEPAADFTAIATDIIAGWRAGGVDRQVAMMGSKEAGQVVLNMTLMEYVAHGCDLAKGVGQEPPFTHDELTTALARGQDTLPEQYRGAGMPFGDIVEVPDDAPVLHRFLGFMGRRP